MANEQYTSPNMSRSEEIVQATIDGTEYNKSPQSRLETLLIELKEAVEAGSGESSDYATALSLTIDSSTYVITASLLNKDGDTLGTAQTIDLPIESVVVSGSYDSQTKKVILTLQSGSTIEFSVADLVSGLQSEITSANKLSADLVDDTNTTHKFVTASDKTTWNNKQNVLTVGTNLDDEPIEDSTNPITSGGVYNTVGNLDAALDSLIMSLEPKTITANGTYNPEDDGVDGYSSVSVDVANSYSQSDNGKVVSNQTLVSQTAYPTEITENDTYDTTNYNSITVNVSGGGGGDNYNVKLQVDDSEFQNVHDWTFGVISAYIDGDVPESLFEEATTLESVVLVNTEHISDKAFFRCTNLTSVQLPQTLTYIGMNAFEEAGITSITIPSSVSTIEYAAFALTHIISITIPLSVTYIGSHAFEDCQDLVSITFESTTPPEIEEDGTLGISTDCIIRVPQGSLSDYTSASNYPDPNDYTYVEY